MMLKSFKLSIVIIRNGRDANSIKLDPRFKFTKFQFETYRGLGLLFGRTNYTA